MDRKIKNYFVHESSYVDNNVIIGKETKVWHFSHIQSGSIITLLPMFTFWPIEQFLPIIDPD